MPVAIPLLRSGISIIDYRCDALPGDPAYPEVYGCDSLSYVRAGSFGCRTLGKS